MAANNKICPYCYAPWKEPCRDHPKGRECKPCGIVWHCEKREPITPDRQAVQLEEAAKVVAALTGGTKGEKL